MAEETRRGKLTDVQVDFFAKKLNARFDIRLIPEWGEGLIFKGFVIGADYLISRALGPDLYGLAFKLGEGVEDPKELEDLTIQLSVILAGQLPMPWIGKNRKEEIILAVVVMLTQGMMKNESVDAIIKPQPPVERVSDIGKPQDTEGY